MFQPDLLKNKRILITGGGSGLGKSFARRFCELGASVVICGRRVHVLQETVEELQKTGAQISAMPCDVRHSEAVEKMFDEIWGQGPLDCVLNNAAGNFIAQTDRLSARAFDNILNIVLHGSVYCSLAAGRRWIDAGRGGTILSIVSSAAWQGKPFTVPSAVAKAGVLNLTKSLAMEWGPKGIRTVAVAPGLFPTKGAWDRLFPAALVSQPQEQQVPLRRLGDHSEIANLCSYLVSDFAGYINGDCITIDGGWSLQQGGGGVFGPLSAWTQADWDAFRERSK